MDHFQIPEGEKHVKLLYLGTEEYDGGLLNEYPQRKKWTEVDLLGQNDCGGRTKEEVDAFFQTWLFFGCLITVFRSVGVKVRTADFTNTAIDGKKYITTAKLPEFIQKWRTGSRKGGTWANSKQREDATLNSFLGRKVLSPVKSALEDHRRYMEKYCGPSGVVSPDVAIAIVALQWTLSSWQKGIGHSDWRSVPDFKLPEAARIFLRDRLLRARWCPSEIAWLMQEMHLDGQYYIGAFECPRYEDDHSNCDAEKHKCGYANEKWKYQTRHTTEECKCEFEKSPDNTLDIIRSGGIPIMSWEEGKLCAVKYNSTRMRYVAISHVWSDGMGNEEANALPRCQLERLQRLTEEVDNCRRHEPPPLPASETCALAHTPSESSEDEEPHGDRYADTELVGFWADMICVPLQPDNLRNDQIGKMRHIYHDASCVLVIDRWVQAVATTANITEKFARLYLSNWQHRLWTCQEGVFAPTLYFQFQDGQQRLTALTEEAHLREDGPRESTIPSLALNIPAFNEGRLDAFKLGEKVHPILEAIRRRTTTKKKDETVCIATLLGLDPGPILGMDADSNRALCEQRMEVLIKVIKTIPQGLIFNRLERLTTAGYRWAPRTFLGQGVHRLLGAEANDLEMLAGETGLFMPPHGLYVHFPAYLLNMTDEQADVSMTISDAKRHFRVHLKIEATALRKHLEELNFEPEPLPRTSKYRIWKHKDYFVRDEKYALVTISRGAPDAVLCVLDKIVGEDDGIGLSWPIHKLRYICLALVEQTELGQSKEGLIPFRFQKKWEWIIS